MIHDFATDLEYSIGERQRVDCEMIRKAIPNCVRVVKTDENTDRRGIDYIATLDGGATVNIDAKTRRKGSVRSGYEPDFVLELWSVCPENGKAGKPGWTCSRSTDVDMILYTFDRDDWDKFYLVPFQHLRMAFQRNYSTWVKRYNTYRQNNRTWQSEAMFVPISVVLKAITDQMIGTAY